MKDLFCAQSCSCSAIYDKRLPRHKGRLFVISEEVNRVGDLFRLANFTVHRPASEVIQAFLHITVTDMSASQSCAQHRCIYSTWQNGVDTNIIRSKLNRHRTRESNQPSF